MIIMRWTYSSYNILLSIPSVLSPSLLLLFLICSKCYNIRMRKEIILDNSDN